MVSKVDGADVALFFYAGHGLQANGGNYLIPVDAQLRSNNDLDLKRCRSSFCYPLWSATPRLTWSSWTHAATIHLQRHWPVPREPDPRSSAGDWRNSIRVWVR
nr:hypothetical protein [Ensifer sp. ENS01]